MVQPQKTYTRGGFRPKAAAPKAPSKSARISGGNYVTDKEGNNKDGIELFLQNENAEKFIKAMTTIYEKTGKVKIVVWPELNEKSVFSHVFKTDSRLIEAAGLTAEDVECFTRKETTN